MAGETVALGGRVFPSKAGAEEHLRQTKDAHSPGDFLVGDDALAVLDALQRHPACSEKVGLGVRRIGLYGNGDSRSGYGFGVERVDGTVARFSYHFCFAAQRRGHADRAPEAFRHVVRPYILRWRDRTFAKHGGRMVCPVTGALMDPQACHVDHVSPSFAQLIADFLVGEELALQEVLAKMSHGAQVEAVLSDPGLLARWVRFHNQSVILRIVSIEGHRLHHGQIDASATSTCLAQEIDPPRG